MDEASSRSADYGVERELPSSAAGAGRTSAHVPGRPFAVLRATARMLARPELEQPVRAVARLVVPALADWCMVELLDDGGARGSIAVSGSTDDRALERRIESTTPCEGEPCSALRVMRTGHTELAVDVVDSGHVADQRRGAALAEIGARAQLCVPIRSGERVAGALTLVATQPNRQLGADDVPVAESLAELLAIALEMERLRAAATGERASRAAVLATVSHDLRTPLHVVMGYADLLDAGIPEPLPESARAHVARVRRASAHMLDLANQVLRYSRLDAGQESVLATGVDLGAFAAEAALAVEPMARVKGLQVEVRGPDSPLAIRTDEGKLRQIVYNLLANAIKFTTEGRIGIAVRRHGRHAVIEVRDSGVGISSADLARIFDDFWQAEPRATPRGGVGLGLSIARRLARLLGGEITAASMLHEGTTFTVTLPLVYRSSASRHAAPEAPAP
jgi:signal transduction histidine kinase